MKTWISILRGINVGGKNKLPMAELREMYETLGFEDVRTYIQSGNVVFSSAKGTDKQLAEKIEAAIKKQFGFEVPVIVRSGAEIKSILESNPYPGKKGIDETKLHVTFLEAEPSKEALKEIEKYDYSPDVFTISGKEVYLHIPGGYGETKLSNTFFEKKLKVSATTRNWNTVKKLAEMAGE